MLDICSGHVQSGERELQAVTREINEELGEGVLSNQELEHITRIGTELCDFRKYGRVGNYIVPWYMLKLKRSIPVEKFSLEQEEVASIDWVEYEKVKQMIKDGSNNIRIPYLPQIKSLLEKLDDVLYERTRDER